MSPRPSAQAMAVDERMDAVRVILRPVGHPLPLGFLALAAATIGMAGLQLDWLLPSDGRVIALMLIAFVFPLQLVASVFGYLARDSVAATGMGVLSGTWLTVGLVQFTSAPGATSKALGLFLFVAAVAMLVCASAAAISKLVPAAVLAVTALRFLVTGLYQWTGSSAWKSTAGTVGIVLGLLAAYAALAIALEDVTGKMVLPLAKRGKALLASTGSLRDQVAEIEREAGIRQQL
jgi:succinate-acetate transporter protein